MTAMRTPLHPVHVRDGAKMTDFHGWEMPLWYEGLVREHRRVRTAAGLFDISHMARLDVTGDGATDALASLLPFDLPALPPGRIKYTFLLNERGGVIDDLLVYRHAGRFSIVANAGNRARVIDVLRRHLGGRRAEWTDRTEETGMIAVQGPAALGIVGDFLGESLANVRYYSFVERRHPVAPLLISRTGYTGEDGVELVMPSGSAIRVWEALRGIGKDRGLAPVGLGARDTLRLEAAMPLHGHELSESITPLEAGLERAFQIETPVYPGREALLAQREAGVTRIRVGLRVTEGKRVPREGAPVCVGGRDVGIVTSGTFSPTLEVPIALALVPPALAVAGTALEIRIRDRAVPAVVVALPFYKRPSAPK